MIPLSEEVREALITYRNEVNSIAGPYVISVLYAGSDAVVG
jgi:hypothetical protein